MSQRLLLFIYIYLKFLWTKETMNSVKMAKNRQALHWKKLFVNHMPNKGFISIIYKEFSAINGKKPNNPLFS